MTTVRDLVGGKRALGLGRRWPTTTSLGNYEKYEANKGGRKMVDNDPTTVLAAFEILLEEMETEIEFISQAGAKAFAERNYERARAVLERADQATALREKVAELRAEWENVTPVFTPTGTNAKMNGSQDLSRLQRGIRTRETAYFKPILQILNQMGGVGEMSEVLERLPKVMKGTLTEIDYEPLAANSEIPRWWNTAQWAHSAMAQAGLLKPDSPRGVWEMTEAGHKLIAEFVS
jgi:restriction system protein